MSTATIVVLAVIAGLLLYVIGIYNRLVNLKNRFANAFSQIDVQLKRRYDLIPNLVETAKAYLKHERQTLGSHQCRRDTAAVRRGRGSGRRARTAKRGDGSLSGTQGQPDHDAGQRGADQHREQDRIRAAGFQRRGHGIQHLSPEFSAGITGSDIRLYPGRQSAGIRRSRRHRAGAQGVFLTGSTPALAQRQKTILLEVPHEILRE
jgi:hypothetical protein